MKEIWKDIKNYEGLYQISNFGNVKSLEKYRYNGKKYYTQKEKILKQQVDKNGYKVIVLHRNKEIQAFKIHRLVAQAFIPNPKDKAEVNHIDGNKANNNIHNLEWVTTKENVHHAFKNHLVSQHNNTSVEQYSLDGTLLKKWNSISEAQRELKLKKSAISNISACCQHQKPTAFGYIWEYADNFEYRHHV